MRIYLEHFLLDENPGRLNLIQEPLASTLRPAGLNKDDIDCNPGRLNLIQEPLASTLRAAGLNKDDIDCNAVAIVLPKYWTERWPRKPV
jgi:hypothetical protein